MSASFVAAVRYDEVSHCNLVHIRCVTFSGSALTWVLAWRQILEEEQQERFLDLRCGVIHMDKMAKRVAICIQRKGANICK